MLWFVLFIKVVGIMFPYVFKLLIFNVVKPVDVTGFKTKMAYLCTQGHITVCTHGRLIPSVFTPNNIESGFRVSGLYQGRVKGEDGGGDSPLRESENLVFTQIHA